MYTGIIAATVIVWSQVNWATLVIEINEIKTWPNSPGLPGFSLNGIVHPKLNIL